MIRADILLIARIFPLPFGARKNTTQLAHFPRVVCLESSHSDDGGEGDKGDKMLAKKAADKSYAKVLTHDTMGLNGRLALWILGKP